MRKLLTLFYITLSLTGTARIYYTSPAGNDNNSGTINSPFRTLQKAWTVITAGDTLYMRGGNHVYTTQQWLSGKNGTAGNMIKIWNYPGERPVITRSTGYTWPNYHRSGTYFEGNYFHWKGIEFTGFFQPDEFVHSGFMIFHSNNCLFELLEVHHNGAGLNMEGNSSNNLFLNCDSHHNHDPNTGGGNADGIGLTFCAAGTFNTIRGCRAWANSDDGYDVFDNRGFVLFENSWAWDNGYILGNHNNIGGNGEGWKLGYSANTPGTIQRKIINCMAFDNRLTGFHIQEANCRTELYNNISFNNGEGGFNFDYNNNAHILKNNIAFSNNDYQTHQGSNTVASNNSYGGSDAPASWTNNVSNADFISLIRTGIDGPRQVEGSLPILNLLHLAAVSDLIDAGVPVGLPYTGVAPDRGAFETGGAAPPPNQSPVANAGSNQTITLPTNTVTLTGSGTDADGSIASYQWTKIAGPTQFTIVAATQAQTAVNNLVQGVYQFELRVTDNLGALDRDTVLVTVNAAPNQSPSSNAGANQTITLPTNTVTLTGSGTDADGSIVSYQWTKIAGPTQFTIVAAAQAQTAVNNLVQGTYRFELRVTDNLGATGRDTVQITVNPGTNQLPTANAGSNQTITLPTNTVILTGSGIDADGNIASYLWTKIAGPTQFTIVSPTQAQTAVNNLAQGIYQFELRVTDNQGAIGRDTVSVTVNAAPNQPPIANAGTNQTISLPINTITLTGSGTDADGTIASYQWTKVTGPAQFTIVSPTQAQTAVNNLAQGVYQFELRVTDNAGAIDRDTVRITVNAAPPTNQPPIASAGPNQTITLPVNVAGLTGSGTDADGNIVSYQWTKIAGPAQFTIVSPTQAQTIVNNLAQGIYQFELRVTDNLGAADIDTVRITVNAVPNQTPAVNAGPNQTITLPTNTVTLSGIGIDIDGNITAYQWTKIAGPAQFTIVSSAQSQTTVNSLIQGVYRFELRVTDNLGAFGRDTVQVTVNAAPPNQSPTANTGANQTITLPVSSVIVTGSGADADGTIASYQWTKIAGPAQFTILFPTQAQTVINNLVQGVYRFELRVTDNLGATGRDTMQVTVNTAAPSNQAPVADAGSDQSILLPVNSVTQNGGGADPDGSIASYQWRKLTGPAQFSIVSPAQAQTVINNLGQGVYQFELRVTDNTGMSDRDTMQITVYAPVAPGANAGADQIIYFPANTGQLTGSATANSGQSITSYQWAKIAGPAQYTIVSPDQPQTEFTNLVLGIYQFELTVTDNIGLTDKDTVIIEIRDQVTLIQIYPNPAVDFINVSISSSNYSSSSRIAIYNTEGKSVYKEQLTRNQVMTVKNIDITRLSTGLYILEVVTDSKTKKTIMFIKQ